MCEVIGEKHLIQVLNKFEIQCVTDNFIDKDLNIDLQLYSSTDNYELIQELYSVIDKVKTRRYKEVLEMNFKCLKQLIEVSEHFTFVFYAKNGRPKSNYQYLIHPEGNKCPYVKQLLLLLVGISALQEFVKVNVFEKNPSNDFEYNICSSLLPEPHFSDESVLDALGRNGEVVLKNIVHPKLLYVSLLLFFSNNFVDCITHKWWMFRSLMIHQKILSDIVECLYTSITNIICKHLEMKFMHCKDEPLAKFMFYIECAQFNMYYEELNTAEKDIICAQNVLGFGVKFDSIVEKSVPSTSKDEHLIFVKRHDKRYKSNLGLTMCDFPIRFPNQNDNFLMKLNIVDSDGSKIQELLLEEEIVLFAYCILMQKRANAKAYREEVKVLLSYLLSKTKNWLLHVQALLFMCDFSIDNEYCFQVKKLHNIVHNKVLSCNNFLSLLYFTSFPLSYDVDKLYGHVLCEKELFERALKVYEEAHIWKNAISLYNQLGMSFRGIQKLEEQIAIKPSPVLWCYLGDLKENVSIYEVAWELSRDSNARSQRALACYFYGLHNYEKSIKHSMLSLTANAMQPKLLLPAGYSALQCKNFKLAVDLLDQLVLMDDTDFEGWYYLGVSYMEMGDNIRACQNFSMAVNLKPEDRKLWEKYLLLSAEILALEDVLVGFKRFLDNNEMNERQLGSRSGVSRTWSLTHSNIKALRILVYSIKRNVKDFKNLPSSRLKDKALFLLEQLITATTGDHALVKLRLVLMSSVEI